MEWKYIKFENYKIGSEEGVIKINIDDLNYCRDLYFIIGLIVFKIWMTWIFFSIIEVIFNKNFEVVNDYENN